MAAKFSMVNTSGLFDSAAHVEASDRMQGAMEELKIKNERQERAKAAQQKINDAQSAEQKRRMQRALENARANAASSDASFIRAKTRHGTNNANDEAENDDSDYDSDKYDDDYDYVGTTSVASNKYGNDAAEGNDDDDDDAALLAGLDQDPELERLRAVRLAQLKKQFEQKQELLAKGHGEYREIVQDEFLTQVTTSALVLVHFYHNDFERCKILDMHLTRLAKSHIECKFLKINAEKTPFFVEKLAVRVLPTVIGFKDGVAFPERLIGFDGLTDQDDEEEELSAFGSRANYRAKSTDAFPTVALARKLVAIGVIHHNEADEDDK